MAHMRIRTMGWFPIVFFTFKFLVLGIGVYFAVKWHYDQIQKADKGTALRAGGIMAGAFLLLLLGVGSSPSS